MLRTYTCLRCGYHWGTHRSKKPVRCAGKTCRSPYWETARKKQPKN